MCTNEEFHRELGFKKEVLRLNCLTVCLLKLVLSSESLGTDMVRTQTCHEMRHSSLAGERQQNNLTSSWHAPMPDSHLSFKNSKIFIY